MSSPKATSREAKPNDSGDPLVWPIRVCTLIIAFGVLLAYANSLNGPFVFDDIKGIVNNETIRSLWPLSDALNPPMLATGAGGRPIVNLSLAINYTIGGLDVQGYHVFNMLVHALSAMLLFGLVRRTLLRSMLRDKFGGASLWLAFSVALVWALQPLLTASVTAIIQRTELLGGFFYLLTLYAFVRSVEGGNSRRWQIVCVGSCLIGMAAKEIMATVPVIALLFDRTFVAGTFKAAWQARWKFYLALMATWGLLAYLVVINQSRGGMVGFGLGMSSWDYALTQCRAIILYLKLSFWPNPLVLDYGADVVDGIGAVWWQGVLLLSLVAATFWALVRKPMVGFVAFTFFSILAPSSSFIPLTTQTIAEHRMYLPLAAVLVLTVIGIYARGGKWIIPVALALSLVGGVATAHRNKDYSSVVALWADTVEKVPDNSRAQANLAASYIEVGNFAKAIEHAQEALRLKPEHTEARYNLGNAYLRMERFEEAMTHYRQVLALDPSYGMAHYGLGYCLVRTNQIGEAVTAFTRAYELRPRDATVLRSLASSQAYAGKLDAAIMHYENLLKLVPPDAVVASELAGLLGRVGRDAEALNFYKEALRLNPRNSRVRFAMALSLLKLERYATAANELRQVLSAYPDLAEGHHALGLALLGLERWDEAAREFKTTLRLNPQFNGARQNLDRAELLRDFRR